MAEYSNTTVGNYYSDTSGVHLDAAKSGHLDYLYKHDTKTIMNASTKDDGITYGISTTCDDNEETDIASVKDRNPYVIKTIKSADMIMVSEIRNGEQSASGAMWNNISFANYVRLRWKTNIVVNTSNFLGLACNIRDAGDWTIKWTGQPMLDQWITQSGKQIYDMTIDMFMTCEGVKRFNPIFEWTLSFNVPFSTGWNFIMTTVQTVLATPYFNYSLFPAITFREPSNRYQLIDNLTETDQNPPDKQVEQVTYLYPPLPTAPLIDTSDSELDVHHRKATKKKTALTRLKRFFNPSKKT